MVGILKRHFLLTDLVTAVLVGLVVAFALSGRLTGEEQLGLVRRVLLVLFILDMLLLLAVWFVTERVERRLDILPFYEYLRSSEAYPAIGRTFFETRIALGLLAVMSALGAFGLETNPAFFVGLIIVALLVGAARVMRSLWIVLRVGSIERAGRRVLENEQE